MSTALCVLLLELGLNLNSHFISGDGQRHPDYLYGLRANRTMSHTTDEADGGQTVSYTTNRYGYRGPSPQAGKDQYRIVVYGDSFIEANYTPEAVTFVRQLEAKLQLRCRADLLVFNAGVRGYGPDQSLLRLERELPLFKPDLVVFSVYSGNDYGDIIRNRLFKLDSSGKLLRQKSNTGLMQYRNWKPRLIRELNGVLASFSKSQTAVADRLDLEQSLSILQAEYFSYRESTHALLHGGLDRVDVDLALGAEYVGEKISVFREVLAATQRLLEQQQVAFAALIVPDAYSLHHSKHLFKDSPLSKRYRNSALTDTTEEIVRGLEIPYLNLFQTFQQGDLQRYYFQKDTHWTALGQQLAAEKFAGLLVAEGIVPCVQ